MIKVVDKLLLFLYSIVIGCISVFLLCIGFRLDIAKDSLNDLVSDLYRLDSLQITFAVSWRHPIYSQLAVFYRIASPRIGFRSVH